MGILFIKFKLYNNEEFQVCSNNGKVFKNHKINYNRFYDQQEQIKFKTKIREIAEESFLNGLDITVDLDENSEKKNYLC